MAPGNGWEQWQNHILIELKRLSDACEGFPRAMEDLTKKVNDEMTELKTDIAMLKVKSGVYGLVGGAILLVMYILARSIGG